MSISLVGIVGAGTMGSGIAQNIIQSGIDVVLLDVRDDIVNNGIEMINNNLNRLVKKGKISKEEIDVITKRIKGTIDLNDLEEVDIVIEAVIENMEVKKNIFNKVDSVCKSNSILASNTSGLSITEIASATKRPQKVIGLHFFNPVPVMKLVEIIKGEKTSKETFDVVYDFACNKLNKQPITVNEAPLFVVNRILIPMINEAAYVLMEGTANVEDIDKGMKLGANHPIGPLALADLIGIDVVLSIQDTLYRETGDSKYRSCPIIRKMVRAGHIGRKSGKGFYSYGD